MGEFPKNLGEFEVAQTAGVTVDALGLAGNGLHDAIAQQRANETQQYGGSYFSDALQKGLFGPQYSASGIHRQ